MPNRMLNLNRRLERNDRREAKLSKNKSKGFWKKILILLFILGLIYVPTRLVYGSLKDIVSSTRAISEAAKNENLDQIRSNLQSMERSTRNLQLGLNFFLPLRIIPFLGDYYGDLRHFAKAAEYELKAVNQIADSLDPYKNELGFSGAPTPGTDRVVQAVKILEKVIPNLDKVEPLLRDAKDEVESIDVAKYPEKIGGRDLRSKVDVAKNFITGVHFAVSQARDALETAPNALGVPSAKNYLIIFQNDKEIRATGGFMTAYAFMKIEQGKVSSSASDDIYRLDEELLKVCENKVCPIRPPEPIVKYLPETTGKPRTVWAMRDSNLSPDLPTSLKEFERMYALIGDGLPFDGIIMIDTHVVEELIKITGPVEVFGTRYTSENDQRCDCPNVIFELENYAQVIEKGEQDRKAILGTLMQQILARALGASADKAPEFINAGVKLANSKHIMFYMHDQKLQTSLSKLNWAGQIRQTDGDYLHINDSNFAGGKSNIYVTQNVEIEIDTEKTKSKLTIEYKNPQKYNAWLNAINRDYVRIYVPKGSKLINSKGSDVEVTTIEDELGKTVFEAFIQVRPQNSRTLSFEYELPKNFSSNSEYPILIQKQSGTKDFPYKVKINGRERTKFDLSGDMDLKVGI